MTKSLRTSDQLSANRVRPILNNLSNYSFKASSLDKERLGASLSVRWFIRENLDVIFTRADKGNVALNKKEIRNILKKFCVRILCISFLKDSNTYTTLKKDPTKKTHQRTLRVARKVEKTGVCYWRHLQKIQLHR